MRLGSSTVRLRYVVPSLGIFSPWWFDNRLTVLPLSRTWRNCSACTYCCELSFFPPNLLNRHGSMTSRFQSLPNGHSAQSLLSRHPWPSTPRLYTPLFALTD